MASIDEDAIRQAFLTRSGGFPPESTSQIYTYCDAACPTDADYDAVFAFLRRWLDPELAEEAEEYATNVAPLPRVPRFNMLAGELDLTIMLTSQVDEDWSEDWSLSVEVPDSVTLTPYQIVTIAKDGAKKALLAAGLRVGGDTH